MGTTWRKKSPTTLDLPLSMPVPCTDGQLGCLSTKNFVQFWAIFYTCMGLLLSFYCCCEGVANVQNHSKAPNAFATIPVSARYFAVLNPKFEFSGFFCISYFFYPMYPKPKNSWGSLNFYFVSWHRYFVRTVAAMTIPLVLNCEG